MNRLKVMIVDDEILAIEHLKRLIDWEQNGFFVVGESARPLQALTQVAELKPDLIIADIRMPHLNGIEFTKRVFAAGHHCKVILLTSYKEFDYAREAISIGVTQYLVKHELEADRLRKELVKVRIAVDEERKRSSMVLKQYLKELTDGQKPTDELASAALEKLGGRQFTYVLMSADEPFPVLPMKRIDRNAPFWDGNVPQLPLHDIEVACKKDGHVGFLLIAKSIASRREAAEKHAEAVAALRNDVQNASDRRVAAVYSEPIDNLNELYDIHRSAKTQIETAKIFGSAVLSSLKHAGRFEETIMQGHDIPEREAIVRLLNAGGMAAAGQLFDASFKKAAGTRSIAFLSQLCEELTSALDDIRAERGLHALKRLAEEGLLVSDQWRTLEGIKAWMLSKAEETLSTVATHRYSRKIRQTIEYIATYYSEDLSAESIAQHIGISGEHLRHLFKQETGQTLLDYITMLRIERAKSLLESGHLKMYEISGKVGYKSSHYFSKTFGRLVGMSPLEYAETRGANR